MCENKSSVYQIITERILEFIEINNSLPWELPWKRYTYEGTGPKNILSKRQYQGINAFILGMMPYSTPFWGTWRQINQLGGSIRKGEKGVPVVYWHDGNKKKEEGGEQVEERHKRGSCFLRYSIVFNLQQTEGIEYKIPEIAKVPLEKQIQNCEMILKGYRDRPKIQFGNDRACYYVGSDLINMPRFDSFKSPEEYYMIMFHELIHSTGHQSRLSRETLLSAKNEDDLTEYGKEELVAEMGAAFLAAESGIAHGTLERSSAYIQSWKNSIAANNKLLIEAAGQAQKACKFILGEGELENIRHALEHGSEQVSL